MHVNFCFNKIYLIGILELTLKCDIQPNTGSNPLTHKPCQPSAAELDVRVITACWVGSAVVLLKIIIIKFHIPLHMLETNQEREQPHCLDKKCDIVESCECPRIRSSPSLAECFKRFGTKFPHFSLGWFRRLGDI